MFSVTAYANTWTSIDDVPHADSRIMVWDGTNIVRGDDFRTADLSLFRNFALREWLKLQMRFEATNALNQVNFQGPVTNQSTTPGAFVATAIPRTGEPNAVHSDFA